jgi:hypothetical protein
LYPEILLIQSRFPYWHLSFWFSNIPQRPVMSNCRPFVFSSAGYSATPQFAPDPFVLVRPSGK